MRRTTKFWIAMCAAMAVLSLSATGLAGKPAAKPQPMRKIPGITAEDPHPNACVDCHKNHPEMKFDGRLSTLLTRFGTKVDDDVLVKAKAAAADPAFIKGKHPTVTQAFQSIPHACLQCHKADSKQAPPFAKLMHAIHLVGGEKNHFLAMAQGDCTHCHKLDQKTGAWSLPTSPEK